MQYPQHVTSHQYNRFKNGGHLSRAALFTLSHKSVSSSSNFRFIAFGAPRFCNAHLVVEARLSRNTDATQPSPRQTPAQKVHHVSDQTGLHQRLDFLCQHGKLEEAMEVVDSMEKSGYELEATAYNSVVSCCIWRRDLEKGDWLRKHMIRAGFDPPGVFMDNQFINLYMKCGKPSSARQVFDEMPKHNLVSWNAMIAGYCYNGCYVEALKLFREMCVTEAEHPNQLTCISAITSCGGFGDSSYCYQVHGYVIKRGFVAYGPVGNALVTMYGKQGLLEEAEAVFSNLLQRDEVSWNALISVNSWSQHCDRAIELFARMQQEGIKANEYAFGSVLKSCAATGNRTMAEQIHTLAIKTGFAAHPIVGTALLDVHAKCMNFEDVKLIFANMPERNIVSWNTVIGRCMESTRITDGLHYFQKMCEMDVKPDDFTFTSVIKAVTEESNLKEGKQLHAKAIKGGLHSDTSVGNSLITMYSNCAQVQKSFLAFNDIFEPDLISWNSMIHSYVQNDRQEEALSLFIDMRHLGIEPGEFTCVSCLAAATASEWPEMGKQLHAYIVKDAIALNAFVGSALIGMYGKHGAIRKAELVFSKIDEKDLITWNTMISAFIQNGEATKALQLFFQMKEEDVEVDNYTFASVLAGCADVTAAAQGRQVHSQILKSRLVADTAVVNALITMYSRLGCIDESAQLFAKLSDKNLLSWTAMISGYAQNGNAAEAIKLFNQMQSFNIQPTGVTFVAVLTACSHAGLTEQAEQYFDAMTTTYRIAPGYEHYACMVDILARAGRLQDAENFIMQIPYEPNALVWKMLLSACRTYGDPDRGRRSMEKIVALEPGDSAAYVLLSNIYADSGKWEDVARIRKLMKRNGVKKEPGKSWIEIQNTLHEFVAGDRSHPQVHDIHSKLHELLEEIKREGYQPQTNLIIDDEKESREHSIFYHSEKLAIALGIISLAPNTTIKIFKNLRVCEDCHTAAKLISKVVGRTIILRDTCRFHHFKDGLCSCRDFW
ncbi:Pentatricopeptide repeat-containing protein [Nymphaea thermarum]|nr:Pentatricopeptide repeat-containing protein [Nymphaea thermarum]